MDATQGKAGQSAQETYDRLTRAWRKRMRGRFAVLGAICLAIIAASFWAMRIWPAASWISGFVSGLAVAMFMVLRMSPPPWIENWQDGAWGEEWTAKALRPLEAEGWTILHDMSAGSGNIDHIAVGPGGVFLLDSKRIRGSVQVDGASVRVQRIESPDLHYIHKGAGGLLGLARETHDRVRERTKINVWVQPVMVVWGDFPQRVVPGRCTVVHGDALAEWLREQPVRNAASRLEQLAEAVRRSWETEAAAG